MTLTSPEPLLKVLEAALKALAAAWPTLAAAITGGQSPEEALKAARDAAGEVQPLTGTDGRWEEDDEAALNRG